MWVNSNAAGIAKAIKNIGEKKTDEIDAEWIKQNLTIKKFWGHSENAARVQFGVAIIAYLLVASVKHTLKSNLSVYEIIQILGVLAFDRTPIRELLTDFQSN